LPLDDPLLGDVLKFFFAKRALAAITSLGSLLLFAASRFSYDLFNFCFDFVIVAP
jgi:hypothetical protein